jgi:hypothetical protein
MNGEKSSNVKGMDRTRSFRRKEKSKLIASRYTKYSSEETIDDFLKEAGIEENVYNDTNIGSCLF